MVVENYRNNSCGVMEMREVVTYRNTVAVEVRTVLEEMGNEEAAMGMVVEVIFNNMEVEGGESGGGEL